MNPSGDSSAIAVVNLREFFHDSVQQALKHQHVDVEDQTEHYVVNVLTTFARSEALYDNDQQTVGLPPLANLLAAALDAPTADQRNQLLQRLGDVSLFVAGFFSHSFARKLVDVDYHIAMGGRAYSSLADSIRSPRGRAIASVFAELANKFQRMVDVLNDVAEMARPATDKDVLRLYEIWLKTGSPRARRLLSQLGVEPVAVNARA
ncbi:MAG TPA: hypothetical protein VHL14_04385 [Steroidobacteraceae bacterium]|nr:hypothetical protein [Steroidobacteraceae bacterium]